MELWGVPAWENFLFFFLFVNEKFVNFQPLNPHVLLSSKKNKLTGQMLPRRLLGLIVHSLYL